MFTEMLSFLFLRLDCVDKSRRHTQKPTQDYLRLPGSHSSLFTIQLEPRVYPLGLRRLVVASQQAGRQLEPVARAAAVIVVKDADVHAKILIGAQTKHVERQAQFIGGGLRLVVAHNSAADGVYECILLAYKLIDSHTS